MMMVETVTLAERVEELDTLQNPISLNVNYCVPCYLIIFLLLLQILFTISFKHINHCVEAALHSKLLALQAHCSKMSASLTLPAIFWLFSCELPVLQLVLCEHSAMSYPHFLCISALIRIPFSSTFRLIFSKYSV